jgi:peptidyl-tRNA hydrolase, PTH1 family
MQTEPSRLRLIVGLGNPGREYMYTRHNVGFMILDRLARRLGVTFSMEKKFDAFFAKAGDLMLLKPMTFMNRSGRPTAAAAQFFRIPPGEILVVYDDVAIAEGRVRLRLGGTAGGHNGMKSLITCLGSDQFPRLRYGIGAPDGRDLVDHVLGKWDPSQSEVLDKSLENAADAITMAALRGLTAAMNHFNPVEKPAPAAPKKPRPMPPPDSPASPPNNQIPPTPPNES